MGSTGQVFKKRQESFTCNRCGACCKGRDVSLALDDIFRLSEFLGMDPDAFFMEYCIEAPGSEDAMALPVLKRDGESCPFLDGNLCRVHFVKPSACEHMPSTLFGSLEYARSKMPPSCAIQHTMPGDWANKDRIRRSDMAAMMLTTIYYSKYGTFKFDLARPFIYRILLFKRNRGQIRRLIRRELSIN